VWQTKLILIFKIVPKYLTFKVSPYKQTISVVPRINYFEGSTVPTAVVVNSYIFSDIITCSPTKVNGLSEENIAFMFMLVSCLTNYSTLKIEAIFFSETSIGFQRITWRYNIEDRTLRITSTFTNQHIIVIVVGIILNRPKTKVKSGQMVTFMWPNYFYVIRNMVTHSLMELSPS
jgi:hypothetical protein